VRWVRSTAALLGCSLLSGASSAPQTSRGARAAVVAVGHCANASTAISARSFRALLQPKVGTVLQSEAETALPLGGLSEKTLEEVERAVSAARKDFYAHQVELAIGHLKQLALDVTRLPPSEQRWKVERDVLTLLAQAQLPADSTAAEATLASILRVEPGYQPDSGHYPPSFRHFTDGVRGKQAELPTNRLDVAVSPSGRTVYVGGLPVGAAPISHHFPAGDYRVEADFGHRSLVRLVHIPSPPAAVAPVELAGSIEGALFADGGPCVEPGADRAATLSRVMLLLGVTRLFTLHDDALAGLRWVSIEEADATGVSVREARSQVNPGAPETDALAALAEWTATGHGPSSVEVLRRAGPTAPASPSPSIGHGQLSGSVLGQPRPTGFTLESFPVNGQIAPSPAVHFSGAQFKGFDQPAGKTSLRVVTDDGRVGIATVDLLAGGNSDVTVRVDPACTASGKVVNAKGQPVAGAHLAAQQLGSRISETVEAGPKGRFLFRELTKGDYQLTIAIGTAHVSRRFSVDSSCTADLGTLILLDATTLEKPSR
jgi:hypothetical protein